MREELHIIREAMQSQDKNIESVSSRAASLGIREMTQREERKTNLIFFNVPECEDDETEKHDTEYLENIRANILKVEVSFHRLTRLGKKSSSPNHSRPLRTTVKSEGERTAVIKAAKRLNDAMDSEIRKISISKDLTPLEREESRKLLKIRVQKKQESQEKGEQATWVIRGDQVVNAWRMDHKELQHSRGQKEPDGPSNEPE